MRKAIGVAAAIFLALLVVLPSSQAAPASLIATSGVPIKLYGATEFKAREGLVVLQDAGPIEFSADELTIEHVRIVSSYVRLPTALEALGERRVTVETLSHPASDVRIQLDGADGFVSLPAADLSLAASQPVGDEVPSDLWRASIAQLSLLLAPQTIAPAVPPLKLAQQADERPLPGATALDAGAYRGAAYDATVSAITGELLVSGATIFIQSAAPAELVAGRTVREAPGSIFVPGTSAGTWSGPGAHTEETLQYYVLHFPDLRLKAAAGTADLYASEVFALTSGFVGFPWAEGRLKTSDATYELTGDQVVLGGELRLHPVDLALDGAPRIMLVGDGDVASVRIGLAAAANTKAEAAAIAGGAAAGLGLLAFAVYYWPSLKYGLSVAFLPLYARVPKEQTLDHKGRELLYDLIKNEPGVSTNHLAKEVPFGWSTLTYHLRVLERNEAIVSVRDGRYKRFFDRTSGRFSNGRKYILAVLKNDASLNIARFIKEKPGSSQKEVAGSFALSPSSVHWHVERLSEVGLVSKTREAHNVKYFPGEAWDHVTIDDLKSLEPKANHGNAPAPDAPASADPSNPAAPGLLPAA